jgi:hypothetical protein
VIVILCSSIFWPVVIPVVLILISIETIVTKLIKIGENLRRK